MKHLFSLLLAISLHVPLLAQNTNIFLDRTFWRSNPSIASIDAYIEKGHNISALNANAFDAVCYALLEKTNNTTIKYLLSKAGNGVNKITHDGRTYLFWAAYKGNLDIMMYLLQNGAKTDVIDSHGNTVLNFAASTGQQSEAVYDVLFEQGADLTNEKNKDGANALLLIAPHLQNLDLVEYFLNRGGTLFDKDNYGHGLFNYAVKGGNIKVLNQLIEKGIPFKDLVDGGNAFIMASQGTRGHRNTIGFYHYLKQLGISVNVSDQLDRNPLHYIAYRDTDPLLYQFFVKHGVDVNQPDTDGNTPFLNASYRNSLEIIQLLAEQVTDINLKNKKGQTALSRAVQRNSSDVVAYLIKQKSDVSVLDSNGNNLMYYLLNSFNEKDPSSFETKLQLLINQGLDITAVQAKGNTLYHTAVENQNLPLLERLQDFEIDLNHKNHDGLTALHLAAMKATDMTIINYLVSIGADKTLKTDFEETVFDIALENEILRNKSIDLNFLK